MADPAEVSAVAEKLGQVALETEEVALGLRFEPGNHGWHGPAASQFEKSLGSTPGELHKVSDSYRRAATAFYSYESRLLSIQSEFTIAKVALEEARQRVGALGSRLEVEAQNPLQVHKHQKPSVHEAALKAREQHEGTFRALNHVEEEIPGLETQVWRVINEFDEERGHLLGALAGAASLAPPAPPWYAKLADTEWRGLEVVAGGVADIFVKTVHGAEDFPAALGAALHEHNARAFHRLAEDALDVATGVAVAGTVVVGGEALAGAAGAADAAAGAGETAAGVEGAVGSGAKSVVGASSRVSAAAGAGAGGADIADGHPWKGAAELGGAVAGVALDGTGHSLADELGVGERQVDDAPSAAAKKLAERNSDTKGALAGEAQDKAKESVEHKIAAQEPDKEKHKQLVGAR